MTEPESLIDTVEEERAKYDSPLSDEDAGKVVNAVAWRHRPEGWVLAAKASSFPVPAAYSRSSSPLRAMTSLRRPRARRCISVACCTTTA